MTDQEADDGKWKMTAMVVPKLEDDEVLIIQTPPNMGSIAEGLEKWLLSVGKQEFVIQLNTEIRMVVCKRDQVVIDRFIGHRRV